MTIQLTMQPRITFKDCGDGTGGKFVVAYDGHNATLKIGNVSIAFDDRNDWEPKDGYTGYIVQLGELRDDPVRLNNQSVRGGAGAAECIARAIATDLGMKLVPNRL